jgi:hypothetical protein
MSNLPIQEHYVRIDVFTAVTMKNAVFWDMPPAQADCTLADLSTLKMEAISSSETSVHTRSTRRHIPEDGNLHNHRRENLKSYIFIII